MNYTNCKVCGGHTKEFLPQFDLMQCDSCEIIFFKKQLNTEYVQELYDKLYNQQDDYAWFKVQAAQMQQGKQPHLGYNKMKVLKYLLHKGCHHFMEIGAGVGIVGNYLQHKKAGYAGIELDTEAARLATVAGINVKNESFHYLCNFSGKDAIISFEVLEHIDNLKLCFKLMHDALKPGGYLGFSVPNFKNFNNLSAKKQQESLGQVGPPVHINFFTVENLAKLLILFGFRVLHLRARPYPSLIWKKKATYKKLWAGLQGKYHGSTLLCIAQRVD